MRTSYDFRSLTFEGSVRNKDKVAAKYGLPCFHIWAAIIRFEFVTTLVITEVSLLPCSSIYIQL